jgi:2-polyprenyl-3-methyl-5-hydroxy-6-metoxy-1,4-benzoquinol methylase
VQNVYDDPQFFAAYQDMRSERRGLHETTVLPALDDLLPDLRGARVVDLGCGDGWLSRLAAERGASSVTGIDPSERMLALARARTTDERIVYRHAFAEDAEVAVGSADSVLSILALHYVADLATTVRRIASWLVPGGTLMAVLEHPNFLAPAPDRGFAESPAGRQAWLLHSYADEGERVEQWFVPGVRKYHRTVSTIVNSLIAAGLRIDRLAEPLRVAGTAGSGEAARGAEPPYVLAVRGAKPRLVEGRM